MSDSLSRFTRYCPIVVNTEMQTYMSHFQQFENSTIGEITESFMFGILAQSIEMRQMQMRVNEYEKEGNLPGIV